MNKLATLTTTLYVAGVNLVQHTKNAYTRRLKDDRGSLTLEQIIWTVAISIVALAIVAIVIAAINNKASQMPL